MVGKVLDNRYQITEKLGSGGSGDVYKAYHVYLKTPWAIKIVSSSEKYADNEFEVLKNLNHPAFPRLVDVIKENEDKILVFDYYEGPTLKTLIEQYGRIEERRVFSWALQILDALSYLHNNTVEPIIYRDLKPSNLIVLPDDSIKLIDFGTARQFKADNKDDTIYLGTPGYAAPEQYGSGQTDVRTDIYNFGMTIFHLLTGTHPLTCNNNQMKEVLRKTGISEKLRSTIIKCVAEDPDERYSNAEEIKNSITPHVQKKRLISKQKAVGKNAVEISVSGIQNGVGVTHFCMLFGMWLKNRGFKTAVLEYGENGDTLGLCILLDKVKYLKRCGYFEIKGLDIYPSMGKEKIDNFQRAEYDYIILDYGIHDEYISTFMTRSDVKLIVAAGADWKMLMVDSFIKKNNDVLKWPNTYLTFPMQNKKSINIIKSYFKNINIITIPYAVNPWKIESSTKNELEGIYNKLFQLNI